jgi:membrane protease subunit HflK
MPDASVRCIPSTRRPQVTRDRLYIDAMQQVYSNVTKVLVESRQGSNLLYLPLDKIMQNVGGSANASGDALPAPARSSQRTCSTQSRR